MSESYEPDYQAEPQQEGFMSRIIDKIGETVMGSDDKKEEDAAPENEVSALNASHRYESFAPQRVNNEVKWHVDGCNYFHAVSIALEQAKESIWILDCKTFLCHVPAIAVLLTSFRVAFTRAVSQTTSRQKRAISGRPNAASRRRKGRSCQHHCL